jgi:hypothetical protein
MVLFFALLSCQLAMGHPQSEPATNTILSAHYVGHKKIDRLFLSMEKGSYRQDFSPRGPWRLNANDIPFLLERANSKRVLKSFPTNPLSSELQGQCSEGMVALWLIEGVRHGSYYPSLNALCLKVKRTKPESTWTEESEMNHPQVAKAYKTWWKKYHADAATGFKFNPLEGTGLAWH